MLKIWGRKNSSNVRKALWIAQELGLDFESIDAGGAFGVVNEPHYRARNPNGLVPMLEDGDLTLWESNTIVRYLCAEYGAELAGTWTTRASALGRQMDGLDHLFLRRTVPSAVLGPAAHPGRPARLGGDQRRAQAVRPAAGHCR